MTRSKRCLGNAVLKVKYLSDSFNPETELFEDIVTSPKTIIRIDFNDGVSLMEDNFKSTEVPTTKFYIEFFDNYKNKDFIDYLSSSNSDFRVTTSDGTVIRLSHDDMMFLDDNKPKTTLKNKNENNGILQYLKRKIVWK